MRRGGQARDADRHDWQGKWASVWRRATLGDGRGGRGGRGEVSSLID